MQLSRPARARDAARICLILLGFSAQARAADPSPETPDKPVGTSVSSKFGYYVDDDGLVVWTPLLGISQRVRDTTTLSVDVEADVLTAASVDVRTSATEKFKETRSGVGFAATHRLREHELDLSGGVSLSHENDWDSVTAGLGFAKELFDKNSTVAANYSFVGNEVRRGLTPAGQYSDALSIHALGASWTQLLARTTYVMLSGSLIAASGQQASVYRYVPVFLDGRVDPASVNERTLADGSAMPLARVPETTPDTRLRWATVARVNHWLPWKMAVSADYRYYADDWDLQSHTTSVSVYQELPGGFTVRLRNRLYMQGAAGFYRPVYVVPESGQTPRYLSMDKELSRYWYDMAGLKVAWNLGRIGSLEAVTLDLKADVQYTRYADFAYLLDRTALVVQSGLSFEL